MPPEVTHAKTWKWPEIEDIHDYPLGDTKHEIDIPKLLPGGSGSIVLKSQNCLIYGEIEIALLKCYCSVLVLLSSIL